MPRRRRLTGRLQLQRRLDVHLGEREIEDGELEPLQSLSILQAHLENARDPERLAWRLLRLPIEPLRR
jgi:hypothetical protein